VCVWCVCVCVCVCVREEREGKGGRKCRKFFFSYTSFLFFVTHKHKPTALRKGSLHEFAWSSMLTCHGPAFLTKYESKISEWVDFVHKANTVEGILSIVEKSHTPDVANPMHTLQLAKQIVAPTLLLGGAEDRVASPSEIKRLASEAGKGWDVILFEGANHNCVFETPVAWREEVVRFLS